MTHSLYIMLLRGLDFTELVLNIFYGTVTRLWARESRVQFLILVWNIFSSVEDLYCLWVHTASYSMGTGAFASVASSRSVQLTTHSI
jgi:hypothetical protein